MIEDTNETIVDRYGRLGYLVNIGEYYLFQPSELNDKQISVFDRSVPIDFKNGVVQLDLTGTTLQKAKVKKPVEGPKEGPKGQEEPKGEETVHLVDTENDKEGDKLVERMRENYDTAIRYSTKDEKVPRGDENWYKHAGLAMKRLVLEQNIPETLLKEFLVKHIVDMLVFEEKKVVLEYITLKDWNEDSFEKDIQKIFENRIVRANGLTGIVFYKGKEQQILVLNEKTKVWTPAETEDVFDINNEIEKIETKKKAEQSGRAYNTIIGFIGNEQKNKYLVFKTKNITLKRNMGARCDESGKIKRIQVLNEILGYEKYDKETSKGMVQFELCAIQEFLLRYYQHEKKEGKTWFLDFEEATSLGM
jgi:hypothetical protein